MMANGVYPVWKPGEPMPVDLDQRLKRIEQAIDSLRGIFDALVAAHAELQSAWLADLAGVSGAEASNRR